MHSLVVALLAILVLAADGSSQQPTTISRYGLSIDLPAGWEGRIYENETGLRVIQAGNFSIAERDDDGDVGEESVQRMGSEGIYIAIWSWADRPPPGWGDWPLPDDEVATLPLQIGRSDFGSFECGLVAPSTAMRAVTVEGRLVQVVVSFGSATPGNEAVAEANRVLSTFSKG
jgi:hypothetical protein